MLALLVMKKLFSLPFCGFRLLAPLLLKRLLAHHRSLHGATQVKVTLGKDRIDSKQLTAPLIVLA